MTSDDIPYRAYLGEDGKYHIVDMVTSFTVDVVDTEQEVNTFVEQKMMSNSQGGSMFAMGEVVH